MGKGTCCSNGDVDMRKFFKEHEGLCKKMFEMCSGQGTCSCEEIFRRMKDDFGKAPQGDELK